MINFMFDVMVVWSLCVNSDRDTIYYIKAQLTQSCTHTEMLFILSSNVEYLLS